EAFAIDIGSGQTGRQAAFSGKDLEQIGACHADLDFLNLFETVGNPFRWGLRLLRTLGRRRRGCQQQRQKRRSSYQSKFSHASGPPGDSILLSPGARWIRFSRRLPFLSQYENAFSGIKRRSAISWI